MYNLHFNHPGSFPLTTNTLSVMQEAWNHFALLAKGFGDNVILSGCEIDVMPGQHFNIADGVIVIEGEVLPFQGGQMQGANLRAEIFEYQDTVVLKNGDTVVFCSKRIAKLSNTGVILSDFVRVKNAEQINTILENKADKQELAQLRNLIPFLEIRVREDGAIVYRNGKFQGNVQVQKSQYSGSPVSGAYEVSLEGFNDAADFNGLDISVFQTQKGIASKYVGESHIQVQTSDGDMTGDSSFILTIK